MVVLCGDPKVGLARWSNKLFLGQHATFFI